MAEYKASKIEDELNNNKWIVTKTNDDGTVVQDNVYCKADANTEQGAINIFKEIENPVELS